MYGKWDDLALERIESRVENRRVDDLERWQEREVIICR